MSDSVDIEQLSDSLVQLVRQIGRNVALDINVSCPAHIESYNPATQRATVRLGRVPVSYDSSGEEQTEDPILIPGVRVRWPRTSSGYLTFPLSKGDTGHVIFSDRCLTLWHKKGVPADPVNGRAHALADAIFEPGLSHDGNTIPTTSQTATVLDGTAGIQIGKSATEFALKGTALASSITTIASTLTAVPAAADLPTVIALANANKFALLSLMQAIQTGVSTKVRIE